MKQDEQSAIALISARGGSKGLPGKNIRPFHGKPLIAWTIEAALECGVFDRVIVSTEDREIGKIASSSGAEIPFLRPRELALDSTPGVDVFIHAVEWLQKNECEQVGDVCLLQPTSPLRKARSICESYQILKENACNAVTSVVEVEKHPDWMLRQTNEGFLEPLGPIRDRPTRQGLEKLFVPNGAIYWVRSTALMRERTVFPQNTLPYLMGKWESVDIDTLEDFRMAEMLHTFPG